MGMVYNAKSEAKIAFLQSSPENIRQLLDMEFSNLSVPNYSFPLSHFHSI